MSVRVDHDMTICFRVDASHRIGTGHVMRCLTLARELRSRGATCMFICREHSGHLGGLIEQQGFEIRLLSAPSEHSPPEHAVSAACKPAHSEWIGAAWMQDAQESASLIQNRKIDWLVVDHYGLDRRWEEALRPHCSRILVIDDLADRPHSCDLLLDQNVVAGMQTRYDGLVPARCGLMIGPHYALLQPEYGALHDRVPPREGAVRRVLVYFGGADVRNFTGMAVDAFAAIEAPDVTLDIVINPTSPHAESIRSKARSDARIALHERIPSLAPLMVQADLAIGASGATTWERLCLGLPTLVVTLAANQIPIAEELDRQGLIRWLGDAREIDADGLQLALANALAEPLLKTWSQACANAIDGQGLARVAQHLLLGPSTPLRARPARLADEALLLEWANDPETRKNAFTSGRIDMAAHRTWFRNRLRCLNSVRIFVIETHEGLPVGQIRFELRSSWWEIGYSIDRRLRGRRIGKALLELGIQALTKVLAKPFTLAAQVKDSNVASVRLFEAMKFQCDTYSENVRRFTRVID